MLKEAEDAAGRADDNLLAIVHSACICMGPKASIDGEASNLCRLANISNDIVDLPDLLDGGGENQSLAGLDIGIDDLEDRYAK